MPVLVMACSWAEKMVNQEFLPLSNYDSCRCDVMRAMGVQLGVRAGFFPPCVPETVSKNRWGLTQQKQVRVAF